MTMMSEQAMQEESRFEGVGEDPLLHGSRCITWLR
jgi:hypothetical protein